ncbi:DUF975 family protein [Agrilactobacillus yilanensis]|uniref:DUF975 family protein n=1 Tax=Agrilactobacillus yilanensis TaxID=2485997 RepID=A0ABW4J562_9LACO|nr:DUF975 family protein [Agrilactobacillus yilanensis]
MAKTSIGSLKRETKALFKGNWLTAIKVTFLPAIWAVIGAIIAGIVFTLIGIMLYQNHSSIWQEFSNGAATSNHSGGGGVASGLLSTLISILLYAGIEFTFLDWLRDPETEVSHPFKSAFQGFRSKNIGTIIVLTLLVILFTFLWRLLFIIPGLIMSYAYRMVFFIYKDHQGQQVGFLKMITMSKVMMKGHKGRLFLLDLSFVGWFALSILCFGIPLFWVLPYYHGTLAAFYNDLAKQQPLDPELF